jgi:peroxiredoxin
MQVLRLSLLAFAAAGLVAAQGTVTPPKTHLKVGDTAPDFELPSTTGKNFKLSDYRGKKNVVVAFFPAAFTGGWTKEITAYQSGIAKFNEVESQVVGISTDNLPTLKHWTDEHLHLEFPLASDFQRKVAPLYGVLVPERGFANRTTFVIDTDGKIQHIEEGSAALDPTGAETACKRLKKS